MLLVDRVGERHHLGPLDVVEDEDVLAPHHPAPDHAVSDGLAHPPNRTPRTRRQCATRPTQPARSVREPFRLPGRIAH